MVCRIVIPARLHSTRLPEKMLADIGGKPLIQHTYERAVEADVGSVVVATDEAIIADACAKFGATVCMTAAYHRSGTERIGEVIDKLGYAADDIVINLQGDEPGMPAVDIRQVARIVEIDGHAAVGTLATPISDIAELTAAGVVKVVLDHQGYALYFSRAVIPWPRSEDQDWLKQGIYLRHIGLYAMRAQFVREYLKMPVTNLETIEVLEQLRVLWHGHKIAVHIAETAAPAGVDTPEDLAAMRRLLFI